MTYALEARGFTLTYPGARRPVFPPLDFAMEPGEAAALRGDSGAGKTSLLLCACGLIPGSVEAEVAGELLLFGRPPGEYTRAELARSVGMVFQNPETQLFCGRADLEVAFGLENLCVPQDEMRARVREALGIVGLWERRGDSPSVLSGGQKQLLALAAALALRPKLLLLDEALSQLDGQAAARMAGVLRDLKSGGQAILLADHGDGRCAFADREIWL
ncbi:MAG: energy-coupling factor ABC transporter ATP-binding protein [Oscillospiraceae bacterium]|jgi:energy-coupling factor transporter ATP-binding protein EcfA2|nr:energy-coupling factor ABC transporter ATP-binding protein [Oscillospiraceae bacterium]